DAAPVALGAGLLAAGGSALGAFGGGGAAARAGTAAGGAGTGAGLGLFSNGGAAGLAGLGGGSAGALASAGGIAGGAGALGGLGASLGASGAGMGFLDFLGNNAGTLLGLAGGLASSGTKNQRTTSTNEPPAYLLPYLQNAAQGAAGLYNQGGPQYFPGQTLAPQSQNTLDALSGISNRARSGSSLVQGAQNYVQNGLQQPISSNLGSVSNPYATPVTAGTQANNPYASATNMFGGDSNPYLDSMFDHALQKAQSGVESQYARAGRNIGASEPVMGDIASS